MSTLLTLLDDDYIAKAALTFAQIEAILDKIVNEDLPEDLE